MSEAGEGRCPVQKTRVKMNIVILTNIMTPYRKFFYDQLYATMSEKDIAFHVVLMADTEPNRNWRYEDYKTDYSILLAHKTIILSGVFVHLNWGLKNLYAKLKPDIVICAGGYMYPALWRTIALRRTFGYKTFFWSESHLYEKRNYSGFKIKVRDFIRRNVISKFDGFWYAGRLSKEFIECYAKKEAKFVFVPNLVDTSKFKSTEISEKRLLEIRSQYNLTAGKLVLFTPARLSPAKGILEFLDLYKEADTSNTVYLIAGDGELQNQIQDFCLKYDLSVKLLGYKSEEEMVDLYSITDIFVLPSVSDPNPLACIEACWMSKPLFVSRYVGNYPEIIREGENGYVFDYESPKEAIGKLNQILKSNEEWRSKAGCMSYSIGYNLYNPQKAVKRIMEETLDAFVQNSQ